MTHANPRTLGTGDIILRKVCPGCDSRVVGNGLPVPSFRIAETFPCGRAVLGPDVQNMRRLMRCSTCGLLHFSHIPSQDAVKSLLDGPSSAVRWPTGNRLSYAFAREIIRQNVPLGGQVLDVGAHNGAFLASLGDEYRKVALEPIESSHAALRIQGIDVLEGFLEEVPLQASTFDCITAFDVLEHLAHPGMCLRRLAIALRPGGVLIAETGDAGSRIARLLGPAWYYLTYLEHFQAFSHESLEAVLTRSGLRAVRMDRVSRFPAQSGPMLRVATRAIAYSVAVWARSPSLWRHICETVQRGSDAAPPDTGCIEDDHLLVVAARR